MPLTPTPEPSSIEITILGIKFPCPQPYGSGHRCSEVEAGILNRVFTENLRNNFAKRVKALRSRAAPVEDFDALQEEFALYASRYRFSNSRELTELTRDPVMVEALRIARGLVKAHFTAKGHTPTEAELEQAVIKVAHLPKVQAEARSRIGATQQAVEELLGNLDDPEERAQSLADGVSEQRGM